MSLDDDQKLRELQTKMRARSDSELLDLLNDKPENWTPEALSAANHEVELRGGITMLQARIRDESEREEQAQRKLAQAREREERERQEQTRQDRERQKQQSLPVAPSLSSVPQPAPQTGGLDFRTLAKFIGVLGVVVACYGVFKVLENQPLPLPPEDSGQFKGWGDFVSKTTDPTKNIFGVAVTNQHRERAREGAYAVIGVGALIAFIAFAIDRSVKKPQ